ncbi:ankyrin repeat domain-containing protein 26-like [Neofelis nebulosa]|uniref:ankyrin repeat domain-containing protein 26-like n=1 Tax=Neofelis nebulosa TaxID=61452 RepID=UPI00272ACB8B|nr:ankyrin repeat domain-containing protein 26-like [Neofelis nebulosa]XP_058557073.1 ankyrin repeat domain-containing protein 26-like [Neofelis nebulosa]
MPLKAWKVLLVIMDLNKARPVEEKSWPWLSDKPGPDDSWPTSASQDLDFGTKEGTAKSATEAKEDGVGIIENVPPEQTVNGSLTSAGGVHKNDRSDTMSALELGEEEDVESPSLPEVLSSSYFCKKHRMDMQRP